MQHEELGEEKQEGWKRGSGWEEQGRRSTEQRGQLLHRGGASYV